MNLTRWSAVRVCRPCKGCSRRRFTWRCSWNCSRRSRPATKSWRTFMSSVFHPICARLTMRGWRRSRLKIRRPIRTLSCRTSTKCGERARPPRPTLRLQVACRHRATPAMFPVNISRTLFCLPQCFSSPAPRESSSSVGCVSSRSLLLLRFSYLPLCRQSCSRGEPVHKLVASKYDFPRQYGRRGDVEIEGESSSEEKHTYAIDAFCTLYGVGDGSNRLPLYRALGRLVKGFRWRR